MTKRKRKESKESKESKKSKKIVQGIIQCSQCLNGTVYRSPSGLYYHMKRWHGHKPKTRNRVLPNEKGFGEDGAPRRQGHGAPKKPKKDSTKIGTTTSDFVKRRLNMDLSYVPCIEDDFWSEENEYRRVVEVLIKTGRRLLSQLYYN